MRWLNFYNSGGLKWHLGGQERGVDNDDSLSFPEVRGKLPIFPSLSDGGPWRSDLAPDRAEDNAMMECLRAEVVKAEEELRQAATPKSKQVALAHLEKALAVYSQQLLGKKPRSSAS